MMPLSPQSVEKKSFEKFCGRAASHIMHSEEARTRITGCVRAAPGHLQIHTHANNALLDKEHTRTIRGGAAQTTARRTIAPTETGTW